MIDPNPEELEHSLIWQHYFPFSAGAQLSAQLTVPTLLGRATANGTAEVQTNSARMLDFELTIPKQWLSIKRVPASLLKFAIEFRADGLGNSGTISGNLGDYKVDVEDNNLSILSYPKSKRRRIDPSLDLPSGDLRFDLVETSQSGTSSVEIQDIQGTELPSASTIRIWSDATDHRTT